MSITIIIIIISGWFREGLYGGWIWYFGLFLERVLGFRLLEKGNKLINITVIK
jgi:hypothetical protein